MSDGGRIKKGVGTLERQEISPHCAVFRTLEKNIEPTDRLLRRHGTCNNAIGYVGNKRGTLSGPASQSVGRIIRSRSRNRRRSGRRRKMEGKKGVGGTGVGEAEV